MTTSRPKTASIRRPRAISYSNYVNGQVFDPLFRYDYNTFDPHPRMHLDLDLAQRLRATR